MFTRDPYQEERLALATKQLKLSLDGLYASNTQLFSTIRSAEQMIQQTIQQAISQGIIEAGFQLESGKETLVRSENDLLEEERIKYNMKLDADLFVKVNPEDVFYKSGKDTLDMVFEVLELNRKVQHVIRRADIVISRLIKTYYVQDSEHNTDLIASQIEHQIDVLRYAIFNYEHLMLSEVQEDFEQTLHLMQII